MKFLSAASTALFSSLLLLAEASKLDPYFACSMDQKIYTWVIHRKEDKNYYRDAEPGEPRGPNGEQYLAHIFKKCVFNGEEIRYLVQASNEHPYTRVFEEIDGDWRPCTYYER